jgi:glutamine amidotransferase
VLATSEYGREFAAVVGHGNIVGMQFHPEKSQAVGLRMIGDWVRRCVAPDRHSEAAVGGRP